MLSTPSRVTEGLRAEINGFVEELLDGYHVRKPPDAKVIHDPIWGTRRFLPHEIALIDSPVIQRLRRIYQTSLSSYTFPSTTHTRFEHSLGAASVAGDMVTAVSRRHPSRVDLDPLKGDLAQVRAAALLHDSGHGFASHVSESIFRWDPLVIQATQGKLADAKASELLAWYIVTSPALVKLLEEINQLCSSGLNSEIIADLIIGLEPSDRNFLAEFVNGPFDADRVDYIIRDAHTSGLKTGIDVDRLLHDMEIGLLQDGKLHLLLRSTHTVEQLLWAKAHFFARVYRHQKVLAADGALQSIVALIRETGAKYCGATFTKVSDFLRVSDFDFLAPKTVCEDKEVMKALLRLRRRELPHRCLAITTHSIKAAGAPVTSIHNLTRLNETATGIETVRRQIWDNIASEKRPAFSSLVVALPAAPLLREASQTYVLLRGRTQPETLTSLFKIDEWLTSYTESHWAGYVFSDEEHSQATAEAAIKVFQSESIAVRFDSKIATSIRNPSIASPVPETPLVARDKLSPTSQPHLPVLEAYVQKRLELNSAKPFTSLYAILILHFLEDLPPLLDRFRSLGLLPARTWLVRKPYQYQYVEQTLQHLKNEGYHIESCTAAEGADQPARRVLADLRRFLKPSDKFVVVEDGGFIAPLLHSVDFSDMREGCIGVVEQTSKGIKNDHVLANASGLKIPVVSVAESWLKLRLEAPEVGEALGFVVEHFVRRYLKRPLNLKVLVIGYGAVGRELAMSLANRGATVTVYDNDPRKQVEATVQRPYHFRVLSDLGDISGQELIMGTTGTTSLDLDILLKASDGTILASGSSDRLEFDIDGIRSHLANPVDESVVLDAYVTWYRLNDGRRLGMLCDGYPINFVLGEGIAKSVVDPILAELIAGAVLLADGKITTPGINSVPEDLESEFWSEYERIASRSGPRSAI